jgi:hypothetical protein
MVGRCAESEEDHSGVWVAGNFLFDGLLCVESFDYIIFGVGTILNFVGFNLSRERVLEIVIPYLL